MVKKYPGYIPLVLLIICGALFSVFTPETKRAEKELRSSVDLYMPELAQPGLNLFHNSRDRVTLMSMDGRSVHTWNTEGHHGEKMHHVRLDRDGHLYIVYQVKRMVKLRPDSSIVWELPDSSQVEEPYFNPHHDFAFAEDGTVLVLDTFFKRIVVDGRRIKAFVDGITRVSKDGQIIEQIPLYAEMMSLNSHPYLLFEMRQSLKKGKIPDLYHCNAIQILSEDIPDIGEKGDVLISVRNAAAVMSFDSKTFKRKGVWRIPDAEAMHQPYVTPDGNFLVFDNGVLKGKSRIFEFDPGDNKIVWQYPDRLSRDLFTDRQGGVELLANGNRLATFSGAGVVAEITTAGKLVWVFQHVAELEHKKMKGLYRYGPYRVQRLPLDSLSWIARQRSFKKAADPDINPQTAPFGDD